MTEFGAAFFDAFRRPSDPDARAEISRLTNTSLRNQILTQLDGYIERGEVSVPNPDVISRVELFPASATVDVDGFAAIDACLIDADLVGRADGSGTLTGEEIFVRSATFTLIRSDGRWIVESVTVDQLFEGQLTCD